MFKKRESFFLRNGEPIQHPWYYHIKLKIKRFYQDITHFPRRIIIFVKKLWDYFPILWKDYDWDYIYFFYLMRHKFSRMEKSIRNGHLLHSSKYAKQIRYAIFLIDRIIKDDYYKEEFKKHYEYWGNSIWNFKDDKNNKHVSTLETYTEKSKKENREKEEKDAIFLIYEKQRKTKQKDMDRLFQHIRKYIEHWWD